MDKVFDRVDEVAPAPGREVSDEEREGVPATDTEASSPLGVGGIINRRGEDVARHEDEPGREHTGQAVQQPGDGGEQHNPGQNPGELAWFVEQPEADQEGG
jgi:hypothetical protein